MKNEMHAFAYGDVLVRTTQVDGDTWFVAKDAATALGYVNPRKALADHVDQEDKGVTKCDTLGGIQDVAIINESGLYSLIFSSKLESARKFKRWVTSEVLPAIRKTGGYGDVQIGDIAERVASAVAERMAMIMAESMESVAERAAAIAVEKTLSARSRQKQRKNDGFRASKEQCGDVLAFCDRYCDISGNKNAWCKLTDLYGLYKLWVDENAGRVRMPRFQFSNALGQLYSIIHVSAQSPRGENVYTIRGMHLKDRYWEL